MSSRMATCATGRRSPSAPWPWPRKQVDSGWTSRSPATSSRCTPVAHSAEQQTITLVLDPDDGLDALRALHARTATLPVRQLLEQSPHTIVAIDQVLATLAIPPPDDDGLPADHGGDFPLLIRGQRRVRSDLLRGLRGRQRSTACAAFDDAYDWMRRWLEDHPKPLAQDTADAIYRLTAAAGTASELLVRAHACLSVLTDDGFRVRADSLDQPQRDRWHEQRPAQHQHDIARAAAIADRCPDTAEAALIALSAVTRCRYALRHLTVARLSPDAAGSALHGHHITAIPPALRPPLRAHRTIAARTGAQTLLTGLGSGRPNKRSMLECYEPPRACHPPRLARRSHRPRGVRPSPRRRRPRDPRPFAPSQHLRPLTRTRRSLTSRCRNLLPAERRVTGRGRATCRQGTSSSWV
jgi:hypothetical protein